MITTTRESDMSGKLVTVDTYDNPPVVGHVVRITDIALTLTDLAGQTYVIWTEDIRNVRISLGREVSAQWRSVTQIMDMEWAASA